MDNLSPTDHSVEANAAPVQPLEFHGKAGEFFRIWIVNTLLSIITLGIYSAWAKVRTRRYFLGNTKLAGSNFDFHADPVKILKGRLIMGVLFLAYFAGGKLTIALPIGAAAIFAVLFPWIVVRGLAFNLGNTSYRNLRFGFKHDYAGAYRNYGICLLLLVFTLGLAYPYVAYRHARFRIDRSRYGTAFFHFHGKPGEFWQTYLLSMAATFGCAIVAAIVMVGLASLNKMLVLAGLPLIYASLFVGTAFVRAHIYNEVAAETNLGAIRFKANLTAGRLAWIYVSNVLACVATLGLLIPWAFVRTARYRIENTQLIATREALDSFIAAESGRESAVADAAADFWDIDLGF